MSNNIGWCDDTINPIVGCSKCSPGCDNCYAERFAARLARNPQTAAKYSGVVDEKGKWTGKINLHMDGCLHAATVTRKPKRFFIGSMSDIFHENIPDEEIRNLFLSIAIVPNHLPIYMVLTKRPQRAQAILGDMLVTIPELHRIWLGVTVCNQAEADAKIPILLQIPAAKRFVSVEPCLGPVDLTRYLEMKEPRYQVDDVSGFLDYTPLLHWVICGGETGPGARPMHPGWARSLRDQCVAAGVPFYFKGWGEWRAGAMTLHRLIPSVRHAILKSGLPGILSANVYRIGKKRAGCLIDGQEWRQFPAQEAADVS